MLFGGETTIQYVDKFIKSKGEFSYIFNIDGRIYNSIFTDKKLFNAEQVIVRISYYNNKAVFGKLDIVPFIFSVSVFFIYFKISWDFIKRLRTIRVKKKQGDTVS